MKQMIRSAVVAAILRRHRFRAEDAVVLSCDPRSGSTWLSEILDAVAPSAVIWEPFHVDNVREVRDLGFSWRQYIPPDADWPEAEALVRDILEGRVVNQWTSWASSLSDFRHADRLIVKCCRANGFLPWMVRRIDFKRRPIHFLRHPFSIAASQIKMGNFGTDGMEAELVKGRYADELSDSADYIRGLSTDEERIVAMWCRTQKAALEDPVTASKVVRICYEDLTLHPEREIARLFEGWGEPVPEAIHAHVRKASRMTQGDNLKQSPEEQVSKWQSIFSEAQIAKMAKILVDFEIKVYDDSPLPRL